jgi:CHAT domain-containing protein
LEHQQGGGLGQGPVLALQLAAQARHLFALGAALGPFGFARQGGVGLAAGLPPGGELLREDPRAPAVLAQLAEVRAIADRYPGRVEADVLPTEAEVKSWLLGRDLVHLAVHGRFVSDQPLLSHLSLRSGGGDDGQLTAAEMYGLPLDAAKLVVLSACETGTAKATHANEVLGMTRGLLFAGADALLLSAWPINDEATAAWMKVFYDAAGSKPPGAAARVAIESMRRDARYRHPYYWGPFLVVGR